MSMGSTQDVGNEASAFCVSCRTAASFEGSNSDPDVGNEFFNEVPVMN